MLHCGILSHLSLISNLLIFILLQPFDHANFGISYTYASNSPYASFPVQHLVLSFASILAADCSGRLLQVCALREAAHHLNISELIWKEAHRTKAGQKCLITKLRKHKLSLGWAPLLAQDGHFAR